MIFDSKNTSIVGLVENFKHHKSMDVSSMNSLLSKKSEAGDFEGHDMVVLFNKETQKSPPFYMIHHLIDANKFVGMFKSMVKTPQFRNRFLRSTVLERFSDKFLYSIKEKWFYNLSDQHGVVRWLDVNTIYEIKTVNPEVKEFTFYIYYDELSYIGIEVTGFINKEGLFGVKISGMKDNGAVSADSSSMGTVLIPLKVLFFLEFAEVETKIIKPNEKIKHHKEKLYNKSRILVEIIDSTYYTTIIRQDGFKVSGHWRWQPTNIGVKLLWINDFHKHGYKRVAKIEKQNENG